MMSLHDIRDLVSSLFIMLNKKTFILFRIEFLVVLVTVLFLAMFVMDIFRRYIHSSAMKAIFSVFDAVSDSIVIYLLGAMQTAPFKNQLFPVWALVLVSFRYSVDFISGYGVPDRGGRRFTEWRTVVKLLGSAFLNWSRGSRFAGPLWSLWAVQILRSWYRLQSHTCAVNSVWHGCSSEVISEHMNGNHDHGRWKPEECDPRTMEGYKYLVYGESVKLQKPRYVLYVDTSYTTCQEKTKSVKQGKCRTSSTTCQEKTESPEQEDCRTSSTTCQEKTEPAEQEDCRTSSTTCQEKIESAEQEDCRASSTTCQEKTESAEQEDCRTSSTTCQEKTEPAEQDDCRTNSTTCQEKTEPAEQENCITSSTTCQEKTESAEQEASRTSSTTCQEKTESAKQDCRISNNKPITRSSLITLDKIWGCRRHLLCSISDDSEKSKDTIIHCKGEDLKDLSLAFALSRLLRCRLEDVMLTGNIWAINRELVKERIIKEKDEKRAFRIMELQLSFVNDYFNTRYPMVFCSGLDSLFLCLLQSVVTIGVVVWLSIDIRRVFKPPHGELAHLVNGFNVDMLITWVFMFFIVFKEIWEMVTYILSDWTRLLLTCKYVIWNDKHTRDRCMEHIILSVLSSKITAKRWHGHLDQYVFMQSYDDRPWIWNLIHKVTTGMVPKKDNGAKLSSAIDVPEYVRPAILEKLHELLEWRGSVSQGQGLTETANANRNKESVNTDGHCLPSVIKTLMTDSNRDKMKLYGWDRFKLLTSSQNILVWHIATSLCEMALAEEHGVDLSKPGPLHTLVSFFTNCFSSKPYLIDVEDKHHAIKFTEDLKKNYTIANSLSRYCAYLLVSKPDLIPDSFLVPKIVFQNSVKSARDKILKGCDSLKSRYDKLMKASNEALDSDKVVKEGAMLATKLLDNEGKEGCWEILAGVWAELLIHIAPTWNAEAHKKCLESGGEFITNIWALLWHCGIEKSDLWAAEDDAPEHNAAGAPQDNNAGNNNSNTEEKQLAGTDSRKHQIITETHGGGEISEAREQNQIKSEIEDEDTATDRHGVA